jgi:NADH-quinone oxidoreductase subunit N
MSMIQTIDYHAILPPLLVAAGALAVLFIDVLVTDRRMADAAGFLVSCCAVVAALDAAGTLWRSPRQTFCVGAYECSYQVGRFAVVMQLVALAGTLLVLLMPVGREGGAGGEPPRGEYRFLLLCSLTGVLVLVSAGDLITLVVALETVSVPAFALVGLRRDSARSAEAALKFFLVSVAATAVMLFGVSLLYGATGSVYLTPTAIGLAKLTGPAVPLAEVALVMTLAGFAFKVSAVPFHFWTPDAYTGAPVPVAAYLSVVSKAAGLTGLIYVLDVGSVAYGRRITTLVGVLAAITMTLGNLVAIRQRHAVRLLAWSTIAQAGYLLVPLGSGSGPQPRATAEYLIIYAAVNLGAFAVVARAADAGATRLADYRGLGRRSPWQGGALAFFLLCLAGLPPGLAGLFAKVVIFRAATADGATWLAVITVVNVVIGLAYYLRWVVALYAEPDPARAAAEPAERDDPATSGTAAVALALAVAVLFSVWPRAAVGVFDTAVPMSPVAAAEVPSTTHGS